MAELEKAIFAGGCFWCLEPAFQATHRIESAVVGYTGGTVVNPSYEQVTGGNTGHREAIQVIFNPQRISYPELLDIFWRQIDPTDSGGQFADRGESYKTAIFYCSSEQKRLAEESKEKLDMSGIYSVPIVTELIQATVFYPAEDYHQHYYQKEPEHYGFYKYGSGRQPYLEKMWGSKPINSDFD
jgi:methionine-S-sulfoxide reductase